MPLPGDQPVKEAGLSEWETALGWQRRTSPEPGSDVMTDPGHAGSAGVAPPHFISRGARSGARGPLHIEAVPLRRPGNARAELARRRLQHARQLDDRGQARLAQRPLQQRDLGPMEVAAIAELFLRDPYRTAGL